MTATDELLANNAHYVNGFDKGSPPANRMAVLACLDACLDPAKAPGLSEGDAHVTRNAAGVASEDALRSLAISKRLLGTEEIVLVHHTDSGMETFSDDAVEDQILEGTGLRPSFALEAIPKAEDDVRQRPARIRSNPFVPSREIRASVYESSRGGCARWHSTERVLPRPRGAARSRGRETATSVRTAMAAGTKRAGPTAMVPTGGGRG
ncbi:MAG TPA: carbonic anhydrase [Acidimicrobiales bacterium]|nr:carbonic anhydrase [Acidimicrobiales bacterium]